MGGGFHTGNLFPFQTLNVQQITDLITTSDDFLQNRSKGTPSVKEGSDRSNTTICETKKI